MNGQLWQPCTVCGTEPVCTACERCEQHCRCATHRSEHDQLRELVEFNRRNQGFLDGAVRHLEQGAMEDGVRRREDER